MLITTAQHLGEHKTADPIKYRGELAVHTAFCAVLGLLQFLK